jgi:hypothetical protein
MAFNTIVIVPDAFLDMDRAHFRSPVLVAAIAGVEPVVGTAVAGGTADGMVLVQREEPVVLEGGWRPFPLTVALGAVSRDLPVEAVLGHPVAVHTSIARLLLKKAMVESTLRPRAHHPGVIAVAGDAVFQEKLLMEGCLDQGL